MGLTTKKAADMSMSLVGLAGDLASFKNIGIEEAQSALKGIFTGETESLKNLGIVMTQTNLEQYAYSQGIRKKIQDMTEAEKVQLRYNYVMSMTKNAQGDFARTSDGAANQMRIFKESLIELGASFGQYLLPVITPIIAKINEWVQAFGKLDEHTKKTILVVAGIVAGIAPVLIVLGKVVSSVGTIINLVTKIGSLVANAGGMVALVTNPITLIIAAIVALIAIFIILYKKNEDFRNNVNQVWAEIKQIIGTVIENLKIIIAVFVQYAQDLWQKHGDKIIATLTALFNFISSYIKTGLQVVSNIIKIITGVMSGDWSKVWEGMKGLVVSVWTGIYNSTKNIVMMIVHGVSAWFGMVWDTTKRIWTGIGNAIMNPIRSAVNFVKEQVAKVKEFFSSIFDNFKLPKLKLPHFNLTGKFSLAPPSIPKISVDWYAQGGILTKPTAFGINPSTGNIMAGGEPSTGGEAIMPLNKLPELMAEAMKQVGFGNSPIYLQIDGQTFAKITSQYTDRVGGTNMQLVERGLMV